MKILFLHLSDFHFEKDSDWSENYVEKIVDSLCPGSIGSVDEIFVFLTGDIAFSGKSIQYEIAKKFLYFLIEQLSKRILPDKLIRLYIVPGNHDNNYDITSNDRIYYEQLLKNNPEVAFSNEQKKQANFLKFSSKKHSLDFRDFLFKREVVGLGGFTIEINMVNSAIFSLKDTDDKGLHYLSTDIINSLGAPTGADMSITLMHHSHQWYSDICKHALEKVLFEKNTLIFYGHEHYLSGMDVKLNGSAPAHIFGGGCLCNRGDWTASEFFASIFDTDSHDLERYQFVLDKGVYKKICVDSQKIHPKPSVNIPHYNTDWVKELMCDHRGGLTSSILEYRVFPRLVKTAMEENDSDEIIANESNFFEQIEKYKHIEIKGADSCGKSTVLKLILNHYLEHKCVIVCRVEDISSGNRKRILKALFQHQYSENPADYARFEQLPKEDKMILIDDLHLIKPQCVAGFLKDIESEFGYVVYTTNIMIQTDIEDRIKSAIAKDSYYQYAISPLRSDKRFELVNNVVRLKQPDALPEDQDRLVNKIVHALDMQRRYIPLTPEVVLQFVNYYTTYQMDAVQNEGGVFGKVFEATITNSLQPHLKKEITIDKALLLLGKVAFFIHCNKKYPIHTNEIVEVISAYCKEYGGSINAVDFISSVVDAGILCKYGEQDLYKFSNNNYLAYFIASEIWESQDLEAVKACMQFACFGINSTVLMFVTYKSSDLTILDMLLDALSSVTIDWPEFRFGMDELTYLKNISEGTFSLRPPTVDEKEREIDADLEKDQKEMDRATIDVISIYDYEEKDIEKMSNQIICAMSLLTTIARCLPNFEHRMKRDMKEKFINALYTVPNKIFYSWAIEVEKTNSELINLMMELDTNEHTRRSISREDAKRILQWESLSLLLELYYSAINTAYRENTLEFLAGSEWFDTESETHFVERLMVLEKANKYNEFIKLAEDLITRTKSSAAKLTALRAVHHYMLRGKLGNSIIKQMESKFFPAVSHSNVLVQRKKLEKNN